MQHCFSATFSVSVPQNGVEGLLPVSRKTVRMDSEGGAATRLVFPGPLFSPHKQGGFTAGAASVSAQCL